TIRATGGESLRVTVGFRSIRVIADQKALESFRQTLRPKEIISYSKDLAEISLLFLPKARGIKGVIAKISTELALKDVNIVGIICNSREDILLVTEADAPRALEALQRMLAKRVWVTTGIVQLQK